MNRTIKRAVAKSLHEQMPDVLSQGIGYLIPKECIIIIILSRYNQNRECMYIYIYIYIYIYRTTAVSNSCITGYYYPPVISDFCMSEYKRYRGLYPVLQDTHYYRILANHPRFPGIIIIPCQKYKLYPGLSCTTGLYPPSVLGFRYIITPEIPASL